MNNYYSDVARIEASLPREQHPKSVPGRKRIAHMLALEDQMTRHDWLRLIGYFWNTCRNSPHFAALRELFSTCSRAELDLLMDETELAAHRELPDVESVYRGCFTVNRDGMSWTLDRRIAEKFPSLVPHHIPGEIAILRRGWVNRDEVAIKLSGFEQEVIAWNVFDITEYPLGYDPTEVIRTATEAFEHKNQRVAA